MANGDLGNRSPEAVLNRLLGSLLTGARVPAGDALAGGIGLRRGTAPGDPDDGRLSVTDANRSLAEGLLQVARQVEQLRQASEGQAATVETNTQAILQNTLAQAGGGQRSAASVAGRAASAIFGSGLGVLPLVTGLARLFGRGRPEPLPELSIFSPPPSIQLEAGLSGAGTSAIQPIRYGQDGLPRAAAGASAMPPITIQVQAIDSRSFLDHSEAIARAVKEAMLNSHSLNDVVSEL